MCSLSLLWVIFPTQGSNPGLPHCKWILYQLNNKRSPNILEWGAYPFSRRSSWPRNWTGVTCIAGGFFTNWAIRERYSINIGWINDLAGNLGDNSQWNLDGTFVPKRNSKGKVKFMIMSLKWKWSEIWNERWLIYEIFKKPLTTINYFELTGKINYDCCCIWILKKVV